MVSFRIWNGMSKPELLSTLQRMAVVVNHDDKTATSLRLEVIGEKTMDVIREPLIHLLLSSRDCVWSTLHIFLRPSIPSEFVRLLHQVLEIGAFCSVYIQAAIGIPIALTLPCNFPFLQKRQRQLILSLLRFSKEQAEAMSQALATSDCLVDLRINKSDFEQDGFLDLLGAIRRNKSLQRLQIVSTRLDYVYQVKLLQSIQGHSTLTKLKWKEAGTTVRPDSVTTQLPITFRELLASPDCRLESLKLSYGRDLEDLLPLFEHMTVNTTVQVLDLSEFARGANIVAQQLFGHMHKFQSLQKVLLYHTRLPSNAFDLLIERPVSSLSHLHLCSCFWKDDDREDVYDILPPTHQRIVQRLLTSHPRLIKVTGSLHSQNTDHWLLPEHGAILDVRRVLERTKSSSMASLLSYLLARVSTRATDRGRQASILHRLLLQGPCLEAWLYHREEEDRDPLAALDF